MCKPSEDGMGGWQSQSTRIGKVKLDDKKFIQLVLDRIPNPNYRNEIQAYISDGIEPSEQALNAFTEFGIAVAMMLAKD